MEEQLTPLQQVYGEDVHDEATSEIMTLKANSNIPFDNKYVTTGISFMNHKCSDILEGKREKPSLKDLVSSSFSEAAVLKYNAPDVYNKG